MIGGSSTLPWDVLMKRLTRLTRKTFVILSILAVIYLGIGFAFHLKWKSALTACRETRRAQGEFVEPEVFGGVLGLVLDVTNWPVYTWANMYHDGTPFATPCTHSVGSSRSCRIHVEGTGTKPFERINCAGNMATTCRSSFFCAATQLLVSRLRSRRAPGLGLGAPHRRPGKAWAR